MDDYSDGIVVENRPTGVAYFRRGYEDLRWHELSFVGEYADGKHVFALPDFDPLVRPGDWDHGIPLYVAAEPFPDDVKPHDAKSAYDFEEKMLEQQLRVASQVEAHTKDLRLPEYLAAMRLPKDGAESFGYFLLWRYSGLAPFGQPKFINRGDYPQPHIPLLQDALRTAGIEARKLHEAGVFHRRGYDLQHILKPSHEEAETRIVTSEDMRLLREVSDFTSGLQMLPDKKPRRWLVLSNNWYVENRTLDALAAEEIADFLWNFWDNPLGAKVRAMLDPDEDDNPFAQAYTWRQRRDNVQAGVQLFQKRFTETYRRESGWWG